MMIDLIMLFVAVAWGAELNLASMNTFAPMWRGGFTKNGLYRRWYRGVDLLVLETSWRSVGQIEYMLKRAADTDIIALQETTADDFNTATRAFEGNFTGFWAKHDPYYWSNQVIEPCEWEPNGVSLFVRNALFSNITFEDVALSNTGNHGALFRGRHIGGKWVRALSIHFDDSKDAKREKESRAASERLDVDRNSHVDFIIGDFNSGFYSDTDGTVREVFRALTEKGFSDVANELNKTHIATHPWNKLDGYASYDRAIDHFEFRGATNPRNYRVQDFNMALITDEAERIQEVISEGGSDHCFMRTTVDI